MGHRGGERDAGIGGVAEWSIATVLKTVVRETAPGVRIPPPPPKRFDMNKLLLESLGLVAAMVVFVLALRAGYFLKISAYWAEMMEEMRKCTWPTWDELLGSTVLVTVATAIIGGFTVGVDYLCSNIIKFII